VLLGVNVWLQQRPAQPDAEQVPREVQAGQSNVEVTFVGTVTAAPRKVGDHERILVRDRLGDTLELDYNTDLGQWVPVRQGDSLLIHGQLYVDPGQDGVHCLHAATSKGCPDPGSITFSGHTYD
ncbi:MAG: hypothetical protein WAM30_20115, partial [Candidatus Dormiibacterota bacterium]